MQIGWIEGQESRLNWESRAGGQLKNSGKVKTKAKTSTQSSLIVMFIVCIVSSFRLIINYKQQKTVILHHRAGLPFESTGPTCPGTKWQQWHREHFGAKNTVKLHSNQHQEPNPIYHAETSTRHVLGCMVSMLDSVGEIPRGRLHIIFSMTFQFSHEIITDYFRFQSSHLTSPTGQDRCLADGTTQIYAGTVPELQNDVWTHICW